MSRDLFVGLREVYWTQKLSWLSCCKTQLQVIFCYLNYTWCLLLKSHFYIFVHHEKIQYKVISIGVLQRVNLTSGAKYVLQDTWGKTPLKKKENKQQKTYYAYTPK